MTANEYIENQNKINEILIAFCRSLNELFPDLLEKKYETGDELTSFFPRMQVGLFIELARGGFIK